MLSCLVVSLGAPCAASKDGTPDCHWPRHLGRVLHCKASIDRPSFSAQRRACRLWIATLPAGPGPPSILIRAVVAQITSKPLPMSNSGPFSPTANPDHPTSRPISFRPLHPSPSMYQGGGRCVGIKLA